MGNEIGPAPTALSVRQCGNLLLLVVIVFVGCSDVCNVVGCGGLQLFYPPSLPIAVETFPALTDSTLGCGCRVGKSYRNLVGVVRM